MKTPDQKLPEGSAAEEAAETPAQERREQTLGIDKSAPYKMADGVGKAMDMSGCNMPESLKKT